MQLSEAAGKLLSLFDPEGVLIGGICGALYGVDRFTRDVDIAADLEPEVVVQRLGTGRKRTEIRDMLDVLNMNFNEDAFADELLASFKQKKENEINRIKARSFAGFRQAGAISSSGCQIKVCVEITAQQMDSQQYFCKS